jgi:hypothetical protein
MRISELLIFLALTLLPNDGPALHARELVDALMVNTSIVILHISLHMCTVPAINIFLKFIRSTPRLEEVNVYYNRHVRDDSKAVQDQYESQMSLVFRAVLQNPSIKALSVNGSFGNKPDAIYDLLSNTRTLQSFAGFAAITTDMAFAMAGGLARNSSLQTVDLSTTEGHLDIALAGIGSGSRIESLEAFQEDGHTKEFYLSLAKVLHVSPSLKTLIVGGSGDLSDDDEPIDLVIRDLLRPACAGLEKLKLRTVYFSAGGTPSLSDIVPIKNANKTVQVLDLYYTNFYNRRSVRHLWNLVGLK